MATKAQGCSCYDKAAPDEPIFVLRAKDKLAPGIVAQWAKDALLSGVNKDKVYEAIVCVAEMRAWQEKNGCKVPD